MCSQSYLRFGNLNADEISKYQNNLEIISLTMEVHVPVKASITFADVSNFQGGGTELGVETDPVLAKDFLIDPIQYMNTALSRSYKYKNYLNRTW